MKINVAFDAGTVNEDFIRCVYAARDFLCANFNGGNQFNIQAGLTTMGGTPISSLGSNTYFLHNEFTYAAVRSAVQSRALSTNALAAFNNNWPVSDPTAGPGIDWTINGALAKTLGLLPVSGGTPDGFFGLGPQGFDFTPNNTAQAASGKFKAFAVILHELTEVMGRTHGNLPQIMCSYSAAGVRQFGSGTPHYFSINNGTTNLRDWNQNTSGDPGDWNGAGGAQGDAFNAFTGSGIIAPMDEIDFVNMDVLGYGRFTPQNPNNAAIGHGRGGRF